MMTQLIDAAIILTQLALVARFIILCIQCADQESQAHEQYKKQKRTVIVALVLVTAAYDIPRLIQMYF